MHRWGPRRRGFSLGLRPRPKGAALSIVQDGLVAEWRFDDGSGTTITDYVGGHDLTLQADASWTTGGVNFDGAGDYADTSVDWQPPTPDYHVDIVAFFDSGATAAAMVFILGSAQSGDLAADDADSPLIVFRGSGATTTFRIGDGTDKVDTGGTTDVFDEGWHHLSIDYDGSALTTRVDGTIDINGTAVGQTPNTITDKTIVGGYHSLDQLWFTGIIGYITVYDRTLDADENATQNAALVAAMAARGITLP